MDRDFDIQCTLSPQQIAADLLSLDANTLIAEMSIRHPDAFLLMKLTGIHPTVIQPILNPYTGLIDNRDFRNVGQHSMACAFAARSIAQELLQLGIIGEDSLLEIEKRALMHDITKRLQVFRKEFYGTFLPPCPRQIEAELVELKIAPELRKDIVLYSSQTGGENLVRFLALQNGALNLRKEINLADKIVRISDNMTSSALPEPGAAVTNYFVTWRERIVLSNFSQRYPEAFRLTLYSNEHQELVLEEPLQHPHDKQHAWGNSLEVENFITKIIASEIVDMLDPQTKKNPEIFLKELINSNLPKAFKLLAA